eukprot:scaffold1487_cov116-Isochrysis_galbana.AAC.18
MRRVVPSHACPWASRGSRPALQRQPAIASPGRAEEATHSGHAAPGASTEHPAPRPPLPPDRWSLAEFSGSSGASAPVATDTSVSGIRSSSTRHGSANAACPQLPSESRGVTVTLHWLPAATTRPQCSRGAATAAGAPPPSARFSTGPKRTPGLQPPTIRGQHPARRHHHREGAARNRRAAQLHVEGVDTGGRGGEARGVRTIAAVVHLHRDDWLGCLNGLGCCAEAGTARPPAAAGSRMQPGLKARAPTRQALPRPIARHNQHLRLVARVGLAMAASVAPICGGPQRSDAQSVGVDVVAAAHAHVHHGDRVEAVLALAHGGRGSGRPSDSRHHHTPGAGSLPEARVGEKQLHGATRRHGGRPEQEGSAQKPQAAVVHRGRSVGYVRVRASSSRRSAIGSSGRRAVPFRLHARPPVARLDTSRVARRTAGPTAPPCAAAGLGSLVARRARLAATRERVGATDRPQLVVHVPVAARPVLTR